MLPDAAQRVSVLETGNGASENPKATGRPIVAAQKVATSSAMDESALKFAERLVPPSYVSQGAEAMRARKSKVRQLLEQVSDLIYHFCVR